MERIHILRIDKVQQKKKHMRTRSSKGTRRCPNKVSLLNAHSNNLELLLAKLQGEEAVEVTILTPHRIELADDYVVFGAPRAQL